MTNEQKETMIKFGRKVNYYRSLAKLTQEKLAELCDCSNQTISGIETGYSFPSYKVLFNLSKALNVPIAYFFNFDNESEISNKENLETLEFLLSRMDAKEKQIAFRVLRAIIER